jgi:copper transport protein
MERYQLRARHLWQPWPVNLRALLVAASVGLLVFIMSPGGASAHAVLLRATPSGRESLSQPPEQVALLFSEPLDPAFSEIRVVSPSGTQVDRGDSHLDPTNDRLLLVSLQSDLGNGIYMVTWRSLSAIDVHPDQGEYRLFVGVPVLNDATTSAAAFSATPETTLARWWFYLAASLFGGVLAAWKVVIGPTFAGAERARVGARLNGLVVFGGVLLILGTLFAAVAQAAAAADVPITDAFGKPLTDLLLRGRFASIWWPRLGLEVASLALIVMGGLDGTASESALATLPAVLLTNALTSHGAALPAAGAGIGVDWLHILGATAWIGGLIGLLMCLPVVRNTANSPAFARRLLGRFGPYALVASGMVLLSGTAQAALELGTFEALVGTLYGQLVLIKVALLLGMLALAGRSEWRARRARAALGGVRGELALGILVLAVAAMLSGTPPQPSGS